MFAAERRILEGFAMVQPFLNFQIEKIFECPLEGLLVTLTHIVTILGAFPGLSLVLSRSVFSIRGSYAETRGHSSPISRALSAAS